MEVPLEEPEKLACKLAYEDQSEGEGQKVKGHAWERHVGATLEKRRTAMENMPELVKEWKRVSFLKLMLHLSWVYMLTTLLQRGHGRGWKKYPK